MKYYNSLEFATFLANKTVPLLRYDKSCGVNEWQLRARQKLMELLGLPYAKCDDMFAVTGKTEQDGYTHISFEFQSEEGYFVPCDLLVPALARGPLPGVICLQGHSTGRHISLGIAKFEGDAEDIAGGRDFAIQAVKQGFCALAMDQRYMGAAGQDQKGHPACGVLGACRSSTMIGRTAVGERVWDVMRLIDVIESHLTEYIDKDRLLCTGNSGGGTTTFYAACADERIKYCMPSCAVCTYDASIIAMKHCACNYVPGIRKYFEMGDLGGLIAPRPLVIVCGKDDGIFPLPGVKQSYELIQGVYGQLGCNEKCRLVIGGAGHRFYPDEAWPEMLDMMQ